MRPSSLVAGFLAILTASSCLAAQPATPAGAATGHHAEVELTVESRFPNGVQFQVFDGAVAVASTHLCPGQKKSLDLAVDGRADRFFVGATWAAGLCKAQTPSQSGPLRPAPRLYSRCLSLTPDGRATLRYEPDFRSSAPPMCSG